MSETTVSGRGRVLAAISGGNFAQLGARFLVGPLVPFVLVEFDTTKSAVGLALTGMWALYALLQFPSGVLADRYGERRLLVLGLGGTILGSALVAVSPTLFLYGVAVLLLGAGTGMFFSPASSLLSRLFEARGGALGALTAGGALAGVIYPVVGSTVGVRLGWRTAMALGAVAGLPFLLATVWLVPRVEPNNPERRLAAALDRETVLGVLGRPSVAYTVVLAVFAGFTFQAVASFLPTFLVEFRGLSEAGAGVVFGVVFGLSALAQPVAGWISDNVSRDGAIAGSVTVAGTGVVVLLWGPGLAGLVGGSALLGVGISWPGPMQARFMDQFTDDERGFGFGLVRSVYMLLAASGSVIVGTLADEVGWVAGFGAVVAVLAAALLVLGVNRALSMEL